SGEIDCDLWAARQRSVQAVHSGAERVRTPRTGLRCVLSTPRRSECERHRGVAAGPMSLLDANRAAAAPGSQWLVLEDLCRMASRNRPDASGARLRTPSVACAGPLGGATPRHASEALVSPGSGSFGTAVGAGLWRILRSLGVG